ncbi:MAG: AAA family ATPase [Clostridia bacterium]|nr:AAA family ATPase [Clostridia bacterium]
MLKKVLIVRFNPTWLLSNRENSILPVAQLVSFIREEVEDYEIVGQSLSMCIVTVKGDSKNLTQLAKQIKQILKEKMKVTVFKNVVDFEVVERNFEDDKKTDEEKVSDKKASDEKPSCCKQISSSETDDEAEPEENVGEKISSLVGAEEFKALISECEKIAPAMIKHKTEDIFAKQCYLFSINDGCGLSTYLDLFAKHLNQLGLFDCVVIESAVQEIRLQCPTDTQRSNESFLYDLTKLFRKTQKVFCVDLSEWLTKLNDNLFKIILNLIEDCCGDSIFIFRVPFVEKETLLQIKDAISDVLTVKDVSFVPLGNDELTECCVRFIEERGYALDEETVSLFSLIMNRERNDGRFYGINTVKKIARQMIYYKQLSDAEKETEDCLIKKADILPLISDIEESYEGLRSLDEYVGMDKIKDRVEEIVAQILGSRNNANLGSPCIHMRFVGNPGTGKTTVARIIGKILKEKGVLRNGNFHEHFARELCGEYVGSTAPKTAAICRDAYGSVLFIDEAYTLFKGANSSFRGGDYGVEAIETLIAQMENHRKDLVVIMAGYSDEMSNLMKANPGLESRMPYIIEFPNYTREELSEIFFRMARKNFLYDEEFENAVFNYFNALSDEVLSSKDFSNARFVRNLFERTWGKAALRAQLNKTDASVLTKEDFISASSETEFNRMLAKKRNKSLGFI